MKLKSILLKIFLILVLVAGVWFFLQYQETKERVAAFSSEDVQQQIAERELQTLLRKVERHMYLPEGELPDVAVVTDVDVLREEQPFFQDAENGDQVLIYSDRIIVFSERHNRLVNVGPIYPVGNEGLNQTVSDTDEVSTPEEVKSPTVDILSLEIRNGSGVAGVAGRTADELESGYEIHSVGDASRKDFAQTLIVNQNNADVAELEAFFGVTASATLPAGENESDADVLIIIGRDR